MRLAASALFLLSSMTRGTGAAAQSLQERIAMCPACHGETGQSVNPDIPSIGGQPRLFVMYQLFFYRDGRRKSPEMNAIAKDISDADLTALSDYVAKLPPMKPVEGPVDKARYDRGATLAKERRCTVCHNADYSGREQMPRLAGQHESYLVKAFKDYQTGARVGTQAVMAEAVHGLGDDDFSALAHYLAHIAP
jgi:cytochrome c553